MEQAARQALSRLLFVVAVILAAGEAEGFGPAAHKIIAHIAEARLEPGVKRRLLADFSIKSLAEGATWADEVRKQRSEGPWHYANIQAGAWRYDRERDCPEGNCVVEKIAAFHRVLKDPEAPRAERREALLYLVHFIGDVHQPLHLGNEADRGGNRITLSYRGRMTNLHALWDGGLIHRRGRSLLQYARDLNRAIAPREASDWSVSGVVAWADESRRLALDRAYGSLPAGTVRLSSKRYIASAQRILDQRMAQAGVRLAVALNQALGKPRAEKRKDAK